MHGMQEPRDSWYAYLRSIRANKPGLELLTPFFPGRHPNTIYSDLTRGFPRSVAASVRKLLRHKGLPYSEKWFIDSPHRTGKSRASEIRYLGGAITSSSSFYESLCKQYGEAKDYVCVRVG